VSTTTFIPFSLPTFLSNTGGSLGLWLGLGMLQLGELLASAIGAALARRARRGKDTALLTIQSCP
jgi:hypothetical protein